MLRFGIHRYICVVQYTFAKIAEITGGRIVGQSDLIVEQIFIDSRQSSNTSGSLFVAIRGEQHDGHKYISELIARGVNAFMVERIPDLSESEEASFVLVSNSVKALQDLASHHRSTHQIPVVGITGSNGKTIVKEWAYQLLYQHKKITRNPRSYNSQVGVPLSLLQLKQTDELGIFEAGISLPNEMDALAAMIQPTIGLFTNIGDAHAAGFTNESEKIYEKLKLFKQCKTLIYRKEDNLLTDIIERFISENGIDGFCWSDSNPANIKVIANNVGENTSTISIQHGGKKATFQLPFTDEASYENAMHACALATYLEVDFSHIAASISELQPIEMRLNQKAGINGCRLISDFYNSDLKSLEIALDWANQRHAQLNRTIILSDIEQSHLSHRDLYTAISNLLKQHNYSRLIGIGEDITASSYLFDLPRQTFYKTTTDFLESDEDFFNEAILLKGARSFAFERIEKKLQQKVHNTVLEVNLNALRNNLNYFKSHLDKNTKVMVMVKAFSYGSGSDEVAYFLQHNNVDYLGVAYADEGVALRKNGIDLPIMVMNSDEDSYDVMLEHNLEPELYNFRSLYMYIEAVQRKAIASAPAHLEINTGMNRLGFDESEMIEVCNILKAHNNIEIKSIFTHFAGSEDPNLDQLSIKQMAGLNACHVTFVNQMGYSPMKHMANSAGIIRFKESHHDMVRLGVGLYGFHPSNSADRSIETVATLRSFISQIRTVKSGEGIGYGNLEPADKERRIAVVAIGYADGLNRMMSRGNGYFMINEKPARIVGNVCMDMTMCDVTEIDCEEGDEVIVFGHQPSIVELAKKLNTIPYEIITSVSERVKRVYVEE